MEELKKLLTPYFKNIYSYEQEENFISGGVLSDNRFFESIVEKIEEQKIYQVEDIYSLLVSFKIYYCDSGLYAFIAYKGFREKKYQNYNHKYLKKEIKLEKLSIDLKNYFLKTNIEKF